MLGSWQGLTSIQRLSFVSLLFFFVTIPVGIWLTINPTNPFSKAGGGASQVILITTGFNLFGLSIETGGNYYAEDLLRDINLHFVPTNIPGKTMPSGNKITTVYKYDATTSSWKIHTLGSTNDANFRIVNSEGYFVRSTWSGSTKLDGAATSSFYPLSIMVNKGWSLISFAKFPCDTSPCENGADKAEGFLELMKQQGITANMLAQFKGGRYVIHQADSEANDFPTLPGEGYWIYNSGEGKQFFWPPSTITNCRLYTYQDKFVHGVGKHCLDKITIKGLYFVAKNQTSGIKQYWKDNMLEIFGQMKTFYENQFDGKMQMAIDEPLIVNGDKNIEEYTQATIDQEIREKVAIDTTESFVVLMYYPIQGENDKRVIDRVYGGGAEVGNSSSAMNSWFWLDPEHLGTVTNKTGTDYSSYWGSAHEFGHALGIPHPWEEEVNRDRKGNIIDPSFGLDEANSVMSYSVRTNPLITHGFLRTEVKEKMIVP